MTDRQLNHLMDSGNPLPLDKASALNLDAAVNELRDEITSGSGTQIQSPRRELWPRVAMVGATCAVALVAGLIAAGSRGPDDSTTAWGAEQIRFAESSPLVLLSAPGWRVVYADEQSEIEGELQFRKGKQPPRKSVDVQAGEQPAPVPADLNGAHLNWRDGDLDTWKDDRAASAVESSRAPVLGTSAYVYQYEGGTPGHRDITALFEYDDRVLEFRAGAASVAAFTALLAKLEHVNVDTWLSALPESTIRAFDGEATVEEMLEGVPVPPGFDSGTINSEGLTKDRYQLGAAVADGVGCGWFRLWQQGIQEGDRGKRKRAVAALQTSKDWPVLKDMAKSGDYPAIFRSNVKILRQSEQLGRWTGGMGDFCGG